MFSKLFTKKSPKTEAEVYASLSEEQKTIARELFVGIAFMNTKHEIDNVQVLCDFMNGKITQAEFYCTYKAVQQIG